MVTVTINGEPTEIASEMTVEVLLDTVEVPPNYLAVEVNSEVVRREDYATKMVHDGDRVEVVTLVGGG
ncbi:MAG: sulfur carrier protein ThiS [Planctomycetota bacterium]